MKIKKLSAYAKKCGKSAMLMTTRTFEGEALRQYVHVGGGIYPIDGLGQLDPEMLLTVFDVTGDERDKWNVAEKEIEGDVEAMMMDNSPLDEAMTKVGLSIVTDIIKLTMLENESKTKTIFVDAEALKPVDDVDEQTFWMRDVGKGEVLIVKSGFMNVGAIIPSRTYWMAEPLMRAANKAWEEKRRAENKMAVEKAMSATGQEKQ